MTTSAASTFTHNVRVPALARMPDAEFQSHIQLDSKIPVLVIKQSGA